MEESPHSPLFPNLQELFPTTTTTLSHLPPAGCHVMTARQALLLVLQGVHLHLPEPLECVPSVRAAQAR